MEEQTEELNNQKLAANRMAAVDKALDEYEGRIGLSKFEEGRNAEEIGRYMNMGRDEIEKLQPEDLLSISYVLSSFSFHIQRSKNREASRVKWANSQLRDSAIPRMNQYRNTGGSFNHIFDAACLGDDYSKKVMKIRDYAQARADRLDFLANGIKDMTGVLLEISRAKRKYVRD